MELKFSAQLLINTLSLEERTESKQYFVMPPHRNLLAALSVFQHKIDGHRKPFPLGVLLFQILRAGAGERIVFGTAIVVRLSPLGPNPALLFQPVERGI